MKKNTIRSLVHKHLGIANEINEGTTQTQTGEHPVIHHLPQHTPTEPALSVVQSTAAEETPFYPFTPDFPTWEGDAAFTGSDYLLLTHNKESKDQKDQKDPLKDPAQPAVFLTPKLLKRVQYLVEKAADKTGECAWMFLGQQLQGKSRHFLLYDMFLAEQDATAAHVDLDLEDVARYTAYLKENWPEKFTEGVAPSLHHGHSHGSMGVFWSSTDKNQQENKTQLGYQNDFRLFLVFNKAKQVFASLVVYYPVFFRVDGIPVGIYTGPGVQECTDLTRAERKLLDEQIDKLIKKPTPTYYQGYGYQHNHANHFPSQWHRGAAASRRHWSKHLPATQGNHRDWLEEGWDMWGQPAYTPEDFTPHKPLKTAQQRQDVIDRAAIQKTVQQDAASKEEAAHFVQEYLVVEFENILDVLTEDTYDAQEQYFAWRYDEITKHLQQDDTQEIHTQLQELSLLGFFNGYSKLSFLQDLAQCFYQEWHSTVDKKAAPPMSLFLPDVLDRLLVLINEVAQLTETIFWESIEMTAADSQAWPEGLIPEGHNSLFDWLEQDALEIPEDEWTQFPETFNDQDQNTQDTRDMQTADR